jgi:hypothetical protein
VEDLLLSVLFSDGGKLNSVDNLFSWESDTGYLMGSGSRFKLFSGGVVDETLLWLVLTSGEDNELALVGVESCNVQLELFLTSGSSSVINGDSDSFGEVSGQTSILKLNKSKTSSVSDFTSILTGGLGNNRTKAFSRSGEDAGSFSNSILVSLDLLSRLIEVSLSSFLPMLAQVDVDDHVVVLDHC